MISDKVALTEMLARLDVLPWVLCRETGKRSRDDTINQFKVPFKKTVSLAKAQLQGTSRIDVEDASETFASCCSRKDLLNQIISR